MVQLCMMFVVMAYDARPRYGCFEARLDFAITAAYAIEECKKFESKNPEPRVEHD